MTAPAKPRTFTSAAKLRTWLERNHAREKELVVRCFKVAHAERGVTYQEVLDLALCFGWIDGVKRAVDEWSFSHRLTPRRPKSRWSAINVHRAQELEAAGRMHRAGLAAFRARERDDARRYSFESRELALSPALAKKFRAARAAWAYFSARPPGYRRLARFWVMSAKREATRERRLSALIACSARGKTLRQLTSPSKRAGR